MKILIVGAGAVGQVFAWHLQRNGARVGFYVRDSHTHWAANPLNLIPMNGFFKAKHVLKDHVLRTRPDEIEGESWDQIWLCMSSPALKSGDWLDRLIPVSGKALFVAFQPGLKDRQWLEERIPSSRLVSGLIPFAAWPSPLPGNQNTDDDGLCYWIPPLASVPFQGKHAKHVVKALNRGRLKGKLVDDVLQKTAYGSAVLLSCIAGLETVDWSLKAFRRSDVHRLVHQASHEAIAIAAAYHRVSLPFFRYALRPWVLRLASRLAPLFFPVNVERYLRFHFSKVGLQTVTSQAAWIEEGQVQGHPTGAIAALRQRLLVHRKTGFKSH